MDYEKLFELALESGADDVKDEDEAVEIVCAPEVFNALKDALDQLGHEADLSEVTRIPETLSQLDGEKSISMQKLIDWLEDNDDVQNVFHNAVFSE